MDYFSDTIAVISESLKTISLDDFERLIQECIEVEKKGNKIICTGLGKNVPVCEKFVGTMNSLGLNSSFMNTNSATHGDIGMVKDGDLVIILTKSGETAESIYLNSLLERRNCKQWLLSFEEDSTLGRAIEDHIIVKMSDEGDLWNIVPNNSTTINLIVLQTVAIQVAKKMGITKTEFKLNHPGGHIGELLKDV